ncbi:MAG: hypothetical protein A2452_03535 [Candidatus Firestonebacteria bacterium RIFOXYC2_FULL_39_67]|nr:MAG: hypothetical protein A2536_00510 [Candidatus Firestonebacteria bacterium RIFOXYD2_FULL_39_29]OGF53070.1 MAG: hypothetical protein A2497_05380 [Candidatus Firestonebacteria bacterium RifOxyC12_full_39_7]OGF57148.1 MAG: hypothetical protein A2452_03535 [Candidatus Firestonebacteria bacterium RIFOXYC2_FULL_39_67]
MDILLEAFVLGIFLLLLFGLGAFFSGVETALISLSRSKTKLLIKDNPKKEKHMTIWLKNPNDVLSTLLIGINAVAVASATLSATMADEVSVHFGLNKALLTALSGILVTFIIIVFGEIVPKIYAIHNAEKTVKLTIVPLYYFHKLINPFTRLFTRIGVKVVKLFGGKADENTPMITREEIKSMVRLGDEEGILRSDESAMLKNVFKFNEKVIKEAMIPISNTFCVNINDNINQILKATAEEGHTRMPVYKDDKTNIVGIIHGKDLVNLWINKKLFVLQDLMRDPYFVNENKKIADLLAQFKNGKIHMAIVKNNEGLITGMITLEDVLEEIVGDINNEADSENVEKQN